MSQYGHWLMTSGEAASNTKVTPSTADCVAAGANISAGVDAVLDHHGLTGRC